MTWQTKKLREIFDNEIKTRFFIALDQLFKNDAFLLQSGVNEVGDEMERGAHERSVAHKLAEYLQEQFPQWHVDCEYNRHELRIKKQNGDKVYPDIIVHHRGIKDNLLVVELKTSGKKNSEDLTKLEGFTQIGKYEYRLGVFLRLQKKDIKECIWYKKGKEYKL